MKMMEKDQLLLKRSSNILCTTEDRRMADSIFHMYSISRLNLDSADDEVYDLLRGCLLCSEFFTWDFLLNSLLLIKEGMGAIS